MPAALLITLGPCQLDLRARELTLNGLARPIEPKVFDLIVLLVERRHRVVTKDELLAALWPDRVVSDGAIARAVMEARKALGDVALIKTVHRVGYRFVGEPDALAAEAAAPVSKLRLGLLPLDNRTNDPRLDWIELGLAALLIQQLDAGGALAPVALPELLLALGPLPREAPVATRVAAINTLLGPQSCVHAALRRQGGAFWLDYQGYGGRLADLAGSLCGDEPAALAQRLAAVILETLTPGAEAPEAAISDDPFVRQAFARAGQMLALHQFRAAAKLLDVVIEFEPTSRPARLAHVRALANLEDPATGARVNELMTLAAQCGDLRTQAQAQAAISHVNALAEQPQALASADARLTEALRLAEPFQAEDWAIRLRLIAARNAVMRGDLAQAREHTRFVEAASGTTANAFQRALALDNRAWQERERGEWLKAHELVERTLQVYLGHQMNSTAALSLMNLSHCCAELGLMQRALDHSRHAETLLQAVQQPHAAAELAEAAASAALTHGSLADLDRVLDGLAAHQHHPVGAAKSGWLVARALRAQGAGDHAGARALLVEALAMAEATGSALIHARRLRQWLELEIAAGDPAALATAQQRAHAALDLRDDGALRALLARAEADRCLRAGDRQGARAALASAIDRFSAGRLQALSRLDAAWLALDEGEPAAARVQLRGLGPWLEEHPLGRALAARLENQNEAPTLLRPQQQQRLPSLA